MKTFQNLRLITLRVLALSLFLAAMVLSVFAASQTSMAPSCVVLN